MSWWNPFQTDANNGKDQAELDAERDQLDAARAARREREAQDLADAGDVDSANATRTAAAEWQRQHNANLANEANALRETPGDAFQDEVGKQADKRRNEASSLITGTLTTTLRLIPWQVWVAAILFALWKLGLMDKLWKKVSA